MAKNFKLCSLSLDDKPPAYYCSRRFITKKFKTRFIIIMKSIIQSKTSKNVAQIPKNQLRQ